jgi:hypothetical protein
LAVAEALCDWLANVLQMVDPWLSAADMDKGVKWRQVINGELERTDFGLKAPELQPHLEVRSQSCPPQVWLQKEIF